MVAVLKLLAAGKPLGPRERRMVQRTIRDLCMLIPYSIVAGERPLLHPCTPAFAYGRPTLVRWRQSFR